MTTLETDFNWQHGYRAIPGWSHYVMNAACDVWSLPRQVARKGGAIGNLAARELKHSAGRVYLCAEGRGCATTSKMNCSP